MTNQNVADGDALTKLLEQISREEQIDVIGGDGAYGTKPCHAAIAARTALPSIPPREGAAHWRADMPGAVWRNGAVDAIASDGRREWKQDSGYHRRSLDENSMYRFKTLTDNCLWARVTSTRRRPRSPFASASSTAWRTSLVRNPFVSPEIMSVDAMASSRSIYATTPFKDLAFLINSGPKAQASSVKARR